MVEVISEFAHRKRLLCADLIRASIKGKSTGHRLASAVFSLCKSLINLNLLERKMKFFIVLAVVATAASAIPLHGGLVNTGHSQVSRHDDGHGKVQFFLVRLY